MEFPKIPSAEKFKQVLWFDGWGHCSCGGMVGMCMIVVHACGCSRQVTVADLTESCSGVAVTIPPNLTHIMHYMVLSQQKVRSHNL